MNNAHIIGNSSLRKQSHNSYFIQEVRNLNIIHKKIRKPSKSRRALPKHDKKNNGNSVCERKDVRNTQRAFPNWQEKWNNPTKKK